VVTPADAILTLHKRQAETVADPEVLAIEGGELRGHKAVGSGEGRVPPPQKKMNFKSKNSAFLCTFKY